MSYLKELYSLFAYRDLLLIFLSIIIGLIIGAEREYRNKTAGLRTLMLVCVGSCTFTILSIKIGVDNPDRLAANIVTGIGFLGAGTIFRDENKVNGITTACTIWVTAALGVCIGSGHIYLAMLTTGVVIFVLWALIAVEQLIDQVNKVQIYKITIEYAVGTAKEFEGLIAGYGLKSYRLTQIKTDGKLTIHWKVTGPMKKHDELAAYLLSDPAIHRIEL
jgi:putative Mg2+ transporter-C (MgtC) family protein